MLTFRLSHATSPTQKRHESAASLASLQQQQPAVVTPASTMKPTSAGPPPTTRFDQQQPVDPALGKRDMSAEPGYADAIRAWTRFRFVKAGWFTAQEAIEYID